jgi:hypothetical protein
MHPCTHVTRGSLMDRGPVPTVRQRSACAAQVKQSLAKQHSAAPSHPPRPLPSLFASRALVWSSDIRYLAFRQRASMSLH